jgi:nucleotide-binding universal stress UspA family protein
MSTIIACIDASPYVEKICDLTAWAAQRLSKGGDQSTKVSLLHVADPHGNKGDQSDLSGQIGLGAKSDLLDELAKRDQEHGKHEQRKGRRLLSEAKAALTGRAEQELNLIHRRGDVAEIMAELVLENPDLALVVVGKHGEESHAHPTAMGANIENMARAIHHPLLITADLEGPSLEEDAGSAVVIKKVLLGYNGSDEAEKALAFIASSPLFKDLDIHLVYVGKETEKTQQMLTKATESLKANVASAHGHILSSSRSVEEEISAYSAKEGVDLLVIGAYSHLKIRSLLLGSATTWLIQASQVPVLLVR